MFITIRQQTKLQAGNVFNHVCDSIRGVPCIGSQPLIAPCTAQCPQRIPKITYVETLIGVQ